MSTSASDREVPSARDVFDRHAQDYVDTIDTTLNRYGVQHDNFTRHKAELLFDLLEKEGLRSADMDLADIGCGTGRLHDFLSGQFRSLTGVDVSEKSLAVARESHPGNTYFSYSGGRLPLESRSADLALAVCVLHHVPPGEWTSFAAEMIRILRPGGFALVIEHNPWNPITRRIVSRCPLDEDAVLLSKKDLAALFDGESIDRVLSRSILSVPAFSATMRRVDSLFGRLPFGAQHFCLARKSKAS